MLGFQARGKREKRYKSKVIVLSNLTKRRSISISNNTSSLLFPTLWRLVNSLGVYLYGLKLIKSDTIIKKECVCVFVYLNGWLVLSHSYLSLASRSKFTLSERLSIHCSNGVDNKLTFYQYTRYTVVHFCCINKTNCIVSLYQQSCCTMYTYCCIAHFIPKWI